MIFISHSYVTPLNTLTNFFLVPQVAFCITKIFHFPISLSTMTDLFLPYTHQLFFSPQHYQHILIYYQLAFLVSSIQIPILARIGHMIFISHSYVTPLTLSSIHSPTFFSPQVASSIIKNITNTYTHNYQLAFLVSSIQTPILARIGHLIFSLSNFKYQSWPGLVT